ncbi:MAG: hypothetical protein MJ077_00745 [Oscillospiraceae bacterium]|nr:hypothetical protein [Oscillospiraceae bacterium]
MTLDVFKDLLFDTINESDFLLVEDISDYEGGFRVIMDGNTEFFVSVQEIAFVQRETKSWIE